MTKDRFRAMLGIVLLLLLMVLFLGRVWGTLEAVSIRLHPVQNPAALSESQGLKSVNGYANW
ncbi:MAG TPA: hypothetical protein VLE70_00485 [Anaerolineae bacterium]|nr:hypothetical protein [Anaerolineae bacterium]